MSPVETKFCPLLKVIWAMEWNLSSLPDANFAGEEWRNLHRNCVPIASLENLEFSSVLLRFPFFFLLLLKRFSQIVRFLPSFLLEHCGYRRCLNEENSKGKDENLDRKRIEKRILVSILRNFLNVLFRTNSHDDFFLADTRLQTNCIDTYNKYEKGGKEGKRLKGIVLSYCNDTINVAIVCVSRNKVGNPCLLVLG